MSRRARERANARPWENMPMDDEDDDTGLGDFSDGCGEPTGGQDHADSE